MHKPAQARRIEPRWRPRPSAPRAGRPRTAASAAAAAVLGVHLEGPFISQHKRGCHPPEHVRSADDGTQPLRSTYGDSLAHVRLVTLAPELPGAAALIDELVARNVVVSAGHSTATLEQTSPHSPKCAGVTLAATYLFGEVLHSNLPD